MIDQEVTQALKLAAREIGTARTSDEILETIAHTALLSMQDVDHVGISVVEKDGTIQTRAWTSDLVKHLDQVQYQLHEGPCYDAMDPTVDQDVVRVDNARHAQRWPNYLPEALRSGLRSQLGTRIYVDDSTAGGLNLYSTCSDTISSETEALAELLAIQAALALGRARQVNSLTIALETRTIIGAATGVLMERYQLDQQRAFQYLTRLSQTTNTKLRDLAQHIVTESSVDAPTSEPL